MDDNEPLPIPLPMVCDCGVNKSQADALMDEIMSRLALGSDIFRARPVTRQTFLADVIRSLSDDLRTTVEHIHVDQWFGVKATQLNANNYEVDIYVQCDRPEYGLAAIWKHLADEKGLAPLE